jgi:guanine deaminase
MDNDSTDRIFYMRRAVEKARITMNLGLGGPFGAVIVKNGEIIAIESNTVLENHDPTAHAEVNAIRKAGEVLHTHDLSGCELYATGYPCPMCLSAIIWANISKVYYGCTPDEAEKIGFRDDFIYRFIEEGRSDTSVTAFEQTGQEVCLELFKEYTEKGKTIY